MYQSYQGGVLKMSSSSNQPACNSSIDYSAVTAGNRIIPFVIELDGNLSRLTPAPGQNQRFCYRFTGVGRNTPTHIDLNHWVLGICPEIPLNQITNISITIGGHAKTVVIGGNVELLVPPQTDHSTACSGLKFDFGLNKVRGHSDSVGIFCFELTQPYPIGNVSLCLKGGQSVAKSLQICGPVCSQPAGCETIASQFVNVCVPVTITPQATLGPVSTTCCGTPAICSKCTGHPGGCCSFAISQLICVEVPVCFDTVVAPGRTHIQCEGATLSPCQCPEPTDTD